MRTWILWKIFASLIKSAIVDDPPLAQKDGGIIREGYHEDVDKFRRSRTDGKKWLTELEVREKERTGIKSLRLNTTVFLGILWKSPIPLRSWCRKII